MNSKTILIAIGNQTPEDLISNLILSDSKNKNNNIIVDLSDIKAVDLKIIKLFLPFAKIQSKNKKSFILVIKFFNLNNVPSKLVAVPTLQEAHDIIEMDEIERDLGF